MNWKKLLFAALLGVQYNNIVLAQIAALNVGDTVPQEMEIGDVINGKVGKYKFSDFKEKLLILDFWATWCTSCIAEMPKMEFLQRQFGDKIFVLPVTAEKREVVNKFWIKYPDKKPGLPSVVEYKHLGEMFDHSTIPFEVWIYNGVVIGMTDAEHVNEKEITSVLAGKYMSFPLFNLADYDFKKTLLEQRVDIAWSKNRGTYYTAVLPFIPRGGQRTRRLHIDKDKKAYKINYVNWTIPDLYKEFLRMKGLVFPLNRMLIDITDSSFYDFGRNGYVSDWELNNRYCFEGSFPLYLSEKEIGEKAFKDLNFYLGLNGRVELREVDCLLLKVRSGNRTKVDGSSNGKVINDMISFDKISDLVAALNKKRNPVIVNENIKGDDNLEFPVVLSSTSDLKVFRAELAELGFDLVPSKRNMDVFVLEKIEH